jgi:ADP-dependent NAD(P)H-hydrate dehydratase / NAD(P)H-hydrate epimerase
MGFSVIIDDEHYVQRPQLLVPDASTHKYDRGHAVIVSGQRFRTGASRLAAYAALGVGAGLVTLAGDEAALVEQSAHVTAIMLRERDHNWSVIDDRVRALAVGPGLEPSELTKEIVLELLEKHVPIVIDAGGLTAFSDTTNILFSNVNASCVLTPHEGEFARLFPDIALENRIFASQKAACRSGAVVLLKGPNTVIAAPNGQYAINDHASPWLATAGSGDVLTGLICGLLAQGMVPFDAACAAAWLHGDIGVRAGAGLTADSMIDIIPLVLQGCLQQS